MLHTIATTIVKGWAKLLLHIDRVTPHATTMKAPSDLLLGRRIRTRLDFLRPNTAERVEKQQSRQKKNHDNHSKLRVLSEGSMVFVRNMPSGEKWIPGIVLSSLGNVSYSVKLEGGRIRKCHIDQLRQRHVETERVEPCILEDAPEEAANIESTSEKADENVEPDSRKEYPKRARRPVETYSGLISSTCDT